MHHHLLAVLCLGATSVFHALPAQSVSPFSRSGMQRIQWGAGSQLTLATLPWHPTTIRLHFEHDADVGAALRAITHRTQTSLISSRTLDYVTVPPAHLSRSLWQAVFQPVDEELQISFAPDAQSGCEVWVNSPFTPSKAIFRWEGMRGQPGNRWLGKNWFELQVEIPLLRPEKAVWSSRLARFGQATDLYTLDQVHAPIIYTQQPGDANLARILIPVAGKEPMPVTSASMRIWQVINLSLNLSHPALGQQMQFSALYAGDPTEVQQGQDVITARRKTLFYSTEDAVGHHKRFHHAVHSDAQGNAFYRWAPVYYPVYADSALDTAFASPYPAVVSALEAQSDAFWFDVAAYYRGFVRDQMGLAPIDSAQYPGNPDAVRDSVILATSNYPEYFSDIDDVFITYVDAGIDLQKVFRNPQSGAASKLFMEWQKWLVAEGTQAESLSGPDFNPAPYTGLPGAELEPPSVVQTEVLRAMANGINVSVYTLPHLIDRSRWSNFDGDWLLHERDGGIVPFLAGEHVDLGRQESVTWYRDKFFPSVLDSVPGLGGLYLDTFGGGSGSTRYPADRANFFSGDYNGGTRIVGGAKQVFDDLRAELAGRLNGSAHPKLPFIATESVQEFLIGRYDAAQHGLKPIPLHTQLSNFVDTLTHLNVDSADATANNPPLWNMVYHEYGRAEVLGMMLSTRAVSASLGGGQMAPKPGVTWDEWADYNRLLPGMMLAQGMKPTILSYFYNYTDQSLLVRRNGQVEVRDPANPRQVELLAFLQRLHGCFGRDDEGGQFLQHGAAERPLALPARAGLDIPQTQVTQALNPSLAAFFKADLLPGVTHGYYEDPLTQLIQYPVPAVFHSVWRATPNARELGIVFVNWTDEPADWQGTFDPRAYAGFGDQYRVLGLRPNGATAQRYSIGSGDGPAVLGWSEDTNTLQLRHHGSTQPGKMPPRSVQVLLIVPR